eukprot:403342683
MSENNNAQPQNNIQNQGQNQAQANQSNQQQQPGQQQQPAQVQPGSQNQMEQLPPGGLQSNNLNIPSRILESNIFLSQCLQVGADVEVEFLEKFVADDEDDQQKPQEDQMEQNEPKIGYREKAPPIYNMKKTLENLKEYNMYFGEANVDPQATEGSHIIYQNEYNLLQATDKSFVAKMIMDNIQVQVQDLIEQVVDDHPLIQKLTKPQLERFRKDMMLKVNERLIKDVTSIIESFQKIKNQTEQQQHVCEYIQSLEIDFDVIENDKKVQPQESINTREVKIPINIDEYKYEIQALPRKCITEEKEIFQQRDQKRLEKKLLLEREEEIIDQQKRKIREKMLRIKQRQMGGVLDDNFDEEMKGEVDLEKILLQQMQQKSMSKLPKENKSKSSWGKGINQNFNQKKKKNVNCMNQMNGMNSGPSKPFNDDDEDMDMLMVDDLEEQVQTNTNKRNQVEMIKPKGQGPMIIGMGQSRTNGNMMMGSSMGKASEKPNQTQSFIKNSGMMGMSGQKQQQNALNIGKMEDQKVSGQNEQNKQTIDKSSKSSQSQASINYQKTNQNQKQ